MLGGDPYYQDHKSDQPWVIEADQHSDVLLGSTMHGTSSALDAPMSRAARRYWAACIAMLAGLRSHVRTNLLDNIHTCIG